MNINAAIANWFATPVNIPALSKAAYDIVIGK